MEREKTSITLQFKLHDAEALLKKIDAECIARARGNMDGSWEDNLFEIVMTRLELVGKNRHKFSQITALIKEKPMQAVKLVKIHTQMIHNILTVAKAPVNHVTIMAFSIMYFAVVESFYKDNSVDLGKTMATLSRAIERLKKLCS